MLAECLWGMDWPPWFYHFEAPVTTPCVPLCLLSWLYLCSTLRVSRLCFRGTSGHIFCKEPTSSNVPLDHFIRYSCLDIIFYQACPISQPFCVGVLTTSTLSLWSYFLKHQTISSSPYRLTDASLVGQQQTFSRTCRMPALLAFILQSAMVHLIYFALPQYHGP